MCKVNVNVIAPELSKIFKELNIFDIKFNGNIESNKGVVLGINFDHSKMSYIPTRRWSVFNEQGNIEAAIFDRNIRKSHAVQSSVRKCLNACQCVLNEEDIKKLEQYFNTPKDIEIKIISDNISDYYAIDHLDLHGSLASSCMQGNDQDYFEIYDSEVNIEMIIAIDAKCEFVGRALLWTDQNGDRYCDRRYGNSSYIEEAIEQYAYDKGFYIKSENSMLANVKWKHKELTENQYRNVIVKTGHYIYSYYPYMDTFKYVYDGAISNIDCINGYKIEGIANETDGELQGAHRCGYCDNTMVEVYHTDNNYNDICESCYHDNFVECNVCSTDHHRDETDCINDSDVCHGCRDEFYVTCSECDELSHEDNTRYYSNCDVILCDDCR